MLDILFVYLGIGVACIPLACYALYTTVETSRREERLVFWLAMLTICIANVFLWPAMSYLIIKHLVLERQWNRKHPKSSDWTAIEGSWKKITSLSKHLDDALNGFLDSDELDGKAWKRIRRLLAEIEHEYDRWSYSCPIVYEVYRFSDDENGVPDLTYLREGKSWPLLKVATRVTYDPLTKERRISQDTHARFDPAIWDNSFNRIFEGEPYPWSVTLSGRFRAAVKKLHGVEEENVNSAVTDIMLSPTTARGNTKTPLSNNLRYCWRYRLGNWRIIYTVDRKSKTVTMLDYAHRSKAYH